MNIILKNTFKIVGGVLAATNLGSAVAQFNVSANSQMKMFDPRLEKRFPTMCEIQASEEYYVSASNSNTPSVVVAKIVGMVPGELIGQAAGYGYRKVVAPKPIEPC